MHEYYQFPLLFSSPLVGLGWQTWQSHQRRWLVRTLLSLTLICQCDDAVDRLLGGGSRQRRIWMPLAETIRRELPDDTRIVASPDRITLLNLARRQVG